MLTPEQAAILEHLRSCPNYTARFEDLVARFNPDAALRINNLVSARLLSKHISPSHTVTLTGKGLEALESYRSAQEKERRNAAAQEHKDNLKDQLEHKRWRKDARRSWVQWTITTILSVLFFFAGAVVEKFTGLLQWIFSFFH